MYIYTITNKVNGKQYVGQTVQKPEKRWKEHKNSSERGSSCAIHRAIRKYGINNFSFKIIVQCVGANELSESEKEWIKKLDTFGKNGYNMTTGGESPSITDEIKKKISDANLGHIVTEQTRQLISKANKGRIHTKESKLNMSISQTGNKNGFYGKTHSKQNKELFRQLNLGKKQSKQTIEKRVNKLIGKTRSEEFKLNLSIKNGKSVIQYDLDNNPIKTFHSTMEASRQTKIRHISCVCLGKRKTAGGFIWRYV